MKNWYQSLKEMLVSERDADAHDGGFEFFIFDPDKVLLILGSKQ